MKGLSIRRDDGLFAGRVRVEIPREYFKCDEYAWSFMEVLRRMRTFKAESFYSNHPEHYDFVGSLTSFNPMVINRLMYRIDEAYENFIKNGLCTAKARYLIRLSSRPVEMTSYECLYFAGTIKGEFRIVSDPKLALPFTWEKASKIIESDFFKSETEMHNRVSRQRGGLILYPIIISIDDCKMSNRE